MVELSNKLAVLILRAGGRLSGDRLEVETPDAIIVLYGIACIMDGLPLFNIVFICDVLAFCVIYF